jgi:hypothetical protein
MADVYSHLASFGANSTATALNFIPHLDTPGTPLSREALITQLRAIPKDIPAKVTYRHTAPGAEPEHLAGVITSTNPSAGTFDLRVVMPGHDDDGQVLQGLPRAGYTILALQTLAADTARSIVSLLDNRRYDNRRTTNRRTNNNDDDDDDTDDDDIEGDETIPSVISAAGTRRNRDDTNYQHAASRTQQGIFPNPPPNDASTPHMQSYMQQQPYLQQQPYMQQYHYQQPQLQFQPMMPQSQPALQFPQYQFPQLQQVPVPQQVPMLQPRLLPPLRSTAVTEVF